MHKTRRLGTVQHTSHTLSGKVRQATHKAVSMHVNLASVLQFGWRRRRRCGGGGG